MGSKASLVVRGSAAGVTVGAAIVAVPHLVLTLLGAASFLLLWLPVTAIVGALIGASLGPTSDASAMRRALIVAGVAVSVSVVGSLTLLGSRI